jgi:antitoxin PrlF
MAQAAAVIEEVATLTAKGQTTVPKSIRTALGLHTGDQIAFRADATGVTLRRAVEEHADPVIGAFLQFLARDMAMDPNQIKPLTPELARRIAELTEGIDVDMDAPIDGEVVL